MLSFKYQGLLALHVTLKKVQILRFWHKNVLYTGNGKSKSKTDEIFRSTKEKNVFDGKFDFLSCDLEKSVDSAFVGAKRSYLGNC